MNLKSNNKSLSDIINMNDDEFENYMIEEYKKKPSNKEIIENNVKNVEGLIREINKCHDRFGVLAYKYGILFKNKAEFILKLCEQKKYIKELMPLLACFICNQDYLFSIKNKKVSIKNYGELVQYLSLKHDVQLFEKHLNEININKEKYKDTVKKIKVEGIINRVNISLKTKRLLAKLYKQYVSPKDPLLENIEYIHELAMENNETKMLYPILVFKFFTQNKSNISKKPVIKDINNLLRYRKYSAIEKDNGKNFKIYNNYISLFLELVNNFSDICDTSLCKYAFEKTSNLVEWFYKNTNDKDVFYYTIESLVEATYGSIFYEGSLFGRGLKDKSYFEFGIEDDDKENYLSDIIGEKLSYEDTLNYLNECVRGKRYAAKYVKKFAYNFLESNNLKLSDVGDEEYIFLNFERVLREKADEVAKCKIVELLK